MPNIKNRSTIAPSPELEAEFEVAMRLLALSEQDLEELLDDDRGLIELKRVGLATRAPADLRENIVRQAGELSEPVGAHRRWHWRAFGGQRHAPRG